MGRGGISGYLIFYQLLGLVLLSCRPSSSKDIELLVLRHEVAILRRANCHAPPPSRMCRFPSVSPPRPHRTLHRRRMPWTRH
jgi:hypothetical protein